MISKTMKAVFLDRDGTINVKMPEGCYVTAWEEFQFLPGTFPVLRELKKRGYLTILVTNQRGIARGIMTRMQLENIHERMQFILQQEGCRFDHIFYCPHAVEAQCSCRKPEPGLLRQAEAFHVIDRSLSYMVGDSPSDIEAGRRYGVKTIRIGTVDPAADYSVKDLEALLKIIL